MKLVIEIPNEVYSHAKDVENRLLTPYEEIVIQDSVVNGTPLPKGHGELVDKNELMKAYADSEFTGDMGDAMEILDNFDAIIEADKEC